MSTKKVSEMSMAERRAAWDALEKKITAIREAKGDDLDFATDVLDELEEGEPDLMWWHDEGEPEVWPLAEAVAQG